MARRLNAADEVDGLPHRGLGAIVYGWITAFGDGDAAEMGRLSEQAIAAGVVYDVTYSLRESLRFADEGLVPAWWRDALEAWVNATSRTASRHTTSHRRTAQSLNDIMQFDQVVQIMDDGFPFVRNDIWAPSLHQWEDGSWDLEPSDKWELISGFSGQHNYPGPIMHSSEFIGGYMERHIRENPGVYVSVVAYPAEEFDEDGNETYPDGWAVARMK